MDKKAMKWIVALLWVVAIGLVIAYMMGKGSAGSVITVGMLALVFSVLFRKKD